MPVILPAVTVAQLRRFLDGFDGDAKVRFVNPDNEEMNVSEMFGLNGEPNIDLREMEAV